MYKIMKQRITDLRIAIASVDVVIFSMINNHLHVFLIPIDKPPFYIDLRGLPGGVIGPKETADESVLRHLKEKSNISGVHIEQLYTFSDPERDKRSRSISVAYLALVSPDELASIEAKANQASGKWFPVDNLPKLAYDHNKIIKVAAERLVGKLAYTNIIAGLLTKQFTLTELQGTYESILHRKLDKRNFRKKILSIGFLKVVGKQKKTVHRPAELYAFAKKGLVITPEIRAVL